MSAATTTAPALRLTRVHAGAYRTTANGWTYEIASTGKGWTVTRTRESDGYVDEYGWAPTLRQARAELATDIAAGSAAPTEPAPVAGPDAGQPVPHADLRAGDNILGIVVGGTRYPLAGVVVVAGTRRGDGAVLAVPPADSTVERWIYPDQAEAWIVERAAGAPAPEAVTVPDPAPAQPAGPMPPAPDSSYELHRTVTAMQLAALRAGIANGGTLPFRTNGTTIGGLLARRLIERGEERYDRVSRYRRCVFHITPMGRAVAAGAARRGR